MLSIVLICSFPRDVAPSVFKKMLVRRKFLRKVCVCVRVLMLHPKSSLYEICTQRTLLHCLLRLWERCSSLDETFAHAYHPARHTPTTSQVTSPPLDVTRTLACSPSDLPHPPLTCHPLTPQQMSAHPTVAAKYLGFCGQIFSFINSTASCMSFPCHVNICLS